MSFTKFVIDSNILMNSKNSYYAFDLLPQFWDILRQHILDGNILVIDKVLQEILVGEDEPTRWIKTIPSDVIYSTRLGNVIKEYQKVINRVASSGYYKSLAVAEWSQEKIADPWIIAVASLEKAIIVTSENRISNLKDGIPKKNAKIPDIADEFNIQTIDLFQMMRDLHFKL